MSSQHHPAWGLRARSLTLARQHLHLLLVVLHPHLLLAVHLHLFLVVLHPHLMHLRALGKRSNPVGKASPHLDHIEPRLETEAQ